MSVDYRALVTVGFQVTVDEVAAVIEYKDQRGEDGDAWFEHLIDNDMLIQLDCYRDPEFYIYAIPEKTITVEEGCCVSILDMWSNLNFHTHQEFIDQFKKDFGPVVDIYSHQLDVFMGLKVC